MIDQDDNSYLDDVMDMYGLYVDLAEVFKWTKTRLDDVVDVLSP